MSRTGRPGFRRTLFPRNRIISIDPFRLVTWRVRITIPAKKSWRIEAKIRTAFLIARRRGRCIREGVDGEKFAIPSREITG